MRILLGSKNPSKFRSLELALKELNIVNYEILDYNVSSNVNSKPIGFEIIRGADNRNQELKKISRENSINYDYLCSIEGGYSLDENGLPFIVTYCIIEDKFGNKSTGKSLGLRITKTMFEYLKDGYSLNKIIEELDNKENNKQNSGITGYLSNGLLNRDKVDKDAVISAFIPLLYKIKRNELDKEIKNSKQSS